MDLDPAILRQIALGSIPPGVAGVLAFAAIWYGARGTANGASRRAWLMTPLVLAVVYALFHALVLGDLAFPPRQSMDWLPIGAGVAAVIGVVVAGLYVAMSRSASSRVRRWMAPACSLVLGSAGLALVGWLSAGTTRRSWGLEQAASHIVPFIGLSLAGAVGAHVLAVRRSALSAAASLLVIAAGASQVLVLAFRSLKLGQSAGLWAALIGGALVVGMIFRRRMSLAWGGSMLPIVMVMAAMFQGALITTTERAWFYMVLVAAAPVLGAAGTIWNPERSRGKRMTAAVLPVLLALAPLLAALAMAAAADSGSDYEY